MTVSELIEMLSALEKQDQEIDIMGKDLFIEPIKAVTESWGDGVSYVLDSGEPISQEQAVNALWEHCNKMDGITADIETKAVQLAEVILKKTYTYEEEKNIRLDNVDWSDLRRFLCLMSACRKAVIDDFPLKDYVIIEIPCVTDEYVIMYFVEPGGRCTVQTFDPHAHEIIFQCFFGKPVAVTHRIKGDEHEECENCFDAVYECGNY